MCGADRVVRAGSWVRGGERQGIYNPFSMWPRASTPCWCVCIELKQEDFLAKLLNPRKWSQSASSGWGPVLGTRVFL